MTDFESSCEGVTLTNTDRTSLVTYKTPSVNNINPGLCIDMECDIWTTPLVIDLAGGVTGSVRGAVIPKRELGWDGTTKEDLSRGLGTFVSTFIISVKY